MPWYRTITIDQWRTLAAAKLGWMLDAMDFMLYAMAIGQLRTYFGFNDATAGMLGTITLVMSGVGGVLFGYLADRLGRTRALMGTIVLFSVASLGAATSQSVLQLLLWRALLGIGMGGEWASGAVLISETWPPEHRNKAISIMQSGWAIGYIAAALMAALILGRPASGPEAWRWLFLVGVLPALFTLWIRRYVPEPEAWARRAAARLPRLGLVHVAPNPEREERRHHADDEQQPPCVGAGAGRAQDRRGHHRRGDVAERPSRLHDADRLVAMRGRPRLADQHGARRPLASHADAEDGAPHEKLDHAL